jgi:hypothetical protein
MDSGCWVVALGRRALGGYLKAPDGKPQTLAYCQVSAVLDHDSLGAGPDHSFFNRQDSCKPIPFVNTAAKGRGG